MRRARFRSTVSLCDLHIRTVYVRAYLLTAPVRAVLSVADNVSRDARPDATATHSRRRRSHTVLQVEALLQGRSRSIRLHRYVVVVLTSCCSNGSHGQHRRTDCCSCASAFQCALGRHMSARPRLALHAPAPITSCLSRGESRTQHGCLCTRRHDRFSRVGSAH